MIKVSAYASIDIENVIYLSFKIKAKKVSNFQDNGKMLMIFLKSGTFVIGGNLMLRKINSEHPIMEYIYKKDGLYTFVPSANEEHLLLKD